MLRTTETASLGSLISLRWKHFSFTPGNGAAVPLSWSHAILGIVVDANTGIATVQTGTDHRFKVGDFAALSGLAPASFVGTFAVLSIVDTTHFTIQLKQSGAKISNGSVSVATYPVAPVDYSQAKVSHMLQAQRAFISADSANAGVIAVGPDYVADDRGLAANAVLELPSPQGGKFDLADWYAQGANGADKLNILFL